MILTSRKKLNYILEIFYIYLIFRQMQNTSFDTFLMGRKYYSAKWSLLNISIYLH